MQELESNHVEIYYDIEKLRELILNLTPAKAKEIGIKYRSTLKKMKDRIKVDVGGLVVDSRLQENFLKNLEEKQLDRLLYVKLHNLSLKIINFNGIIL